MGMPGIAVVVLAGVLVAGCSSGASADGSPASTAAPATASPATRDLGPDPGPEAYRALDLCALVDLPAVLAAAGDGAPELTEQPSVPGRCLAEAPNGFVYWQVARARDQLPTAVTAPNDVTEDVDVNAEGEVITDKACTTAHVVTKGYVLSVDGPSPAQAGYCAVVRGVADSLRRAFAEGPALMPAPGPATATSDLCEALTRTGLADLYGAVVIPASADHRNCGVSRDGMAVLNFVRATTTPYGLEVGSEGPSHGDAARNDDGCTVSVFADDGSVKGGYWLTFQDLGPRASCESTVDARGKALTALLGAG